MEPLKDIMHYFFQKCDFYFIFGHQKVEPRPGSGSLSLAIGRRVTEVGVGGRYGAQLKFGASDLKWLTLWIFHS